MRKIFLFTSVIAILISCSSKPKFELEVNLDNINSLLDKEIIIVQNLDGVIFYSDTIKIKKNNFTLNIPYENDALLDISIPESDFFGVLMVAEKGKIKLNIDGGKAHISGTPINDRLQAFNAGSDSVSLLFKNLEKEYAEQASFEPKNQKERDEISKLYNEYRNNRTQLLVENTDRIIAFTKENINNPIGEYFFMTNYIFFPADRQLEMKSFATEKIKKELRIE